MVQLSHGLKTNTFSEIIWNEDLFFFAKCLTFLLCDKSTAADSVNIIDLTTGSNGYWITDTVFKDLLYYFFTMWIGPGEYFCKTSFFGNSSHGIEYHCWFIHIWIFGTNSLHNLHVSPQKNVFTSKMLFTLLEISTVISRNRWLEFYSDTVS